MTPVAPGTAIITIAVWVLGWAAIVWSAAHPNKSVGDAANPAPPPVESPSPKTKVQVIEEDPDRPGHWLVTYRETGTP